MTDSGSDRAESPEEQPNGGSLSRRKVLGGLAAGAGVAAASAFAAGCSKDGGGGGVAGGGGDGPPGYGTGINEGFEGKIELDVRDSVADWKSARPDRGICQKSASGVSKVGEDIARPMLWGHTQREVRGSRPRAVNLLVGPDRREQDVHS